jgi:hypothetical protein
VSNANEAQILLQKLIDDGIVDDNGAERVRRCFVYLDLESRTSECLRIAGELLDTGMKDAANLIFERSKKHMKLALEMILASVEQVLSEDCEHE